MKSSPNPQNAPQIQTGLQYLDTVLITELFADVIGERNNVFPGQF